MAWEKVNATEARLIRNMVKHGLSWSTVQAISGRAATTISRVLAGAQRLPQGRPKKLTPCSVKKLTQAMDTLLKQANAHREVTLAHIIAKSGVDVSEPVARKALKEQGITFAKLKEKPLLLPEDIKERYAWASKRRRRAAAAWETQPHAIIDNKAFQLFTTARARDYAARRSVRGAYQRKGSVPKPHLVKQKVKMKFPARSVIVSAAVIKGRIRMWDYVDGRWNGNAAAAMYGGPLAKALKKAFPGEAAKARPRFCVLEDNDPTGYKSGKALQAKECAGIRTDDLPHRSPDLNVLDYSLWHEIETRMRLQEQHFPKNYKESAESYKQRLRRVAMSLPPRVVRKAVRDMKRRTAAVWKEKGGLISE